LRGENPKRTNSLFLNREQVKRKGLLILIDPGVSGREFVVDQILSSSRQMVTDILPSVIETHF
jgi:hypothetical protein